MSEPRYGVPQPVDPKGSGTVFLRLPASAASPPPPTRFLIRAPREQPDYVAGPPMVVLRLTASLPAPTRFFIQAPREQPDYLAGPPRVLLRLTASPPAPMRFLIRGVLQIIDPVPPSALFRLPVAFVPRIFLIQGRSQYQEVFPPSGPWLRSVVYGTISGITRDNTGAPLGDCAVHLFRTADDVEVAVTGSDNVGAYSFVLPQGATTYYCVAYKAGTVTADRTLPAVDSDGIKASGSGPGVDVAGTTLNTLTVT